MPKDHWSSATRKAKGKRAAFGSRSQSDQARLEAEADKLLAGKSTKAERFEPTPAEPYKLSSERPSGVICCNLKALAVFRSVNGETRVDVTCRKCAKVLEPNLPHKEAIRRAKKGNFYLIEPSDK